MVTFREHSYLEEICSMQVSPKSVLDPHEDVNKNNTQKEVFQVFDLIPLWLGLGLWKHLSSVSLLQGFFVIESP